MTLRVPSIAPVVVAVLAITASAYAQSTDLADVRKKARTHAGPFYLTPTIQLKEVGVDSNIFNTAGDQKSDFTLTVAPRLDVWLPGARRALVQATVATDLVWFAHYASERSVNPQLAGRAEVSFRRLTFFAQEAYVSTRQRANQEIDARVRHGENTASLGIDVALAPKLRLRVAGRRLDVRYDEDARFDGTNLQSTLNRTTTGVQGEARHQLTPFTTIAVRFDNLLDKFEFSPARDARSVRVMPGVEFNPRALVTGRAYVGHRRFTPLRPDVVPEFNGLIAELELSYTLLGATSFGVRYQRDLTYSYEVQQPYFIDTSVGSYIRRALGSRFEVRLSADRHRYVYQDRVGMLGALPMPQRVDDTWNFAASVGHRMGRQTRIGFGVSYWRRGSTTRSFRDYDNLRIGTTATYAF